MMPAVPVPRGAGIRIPVELKLKSGFRYDTGRRAFLSDAGERFDPSRDLPKGTRIVYKTPTLADADPRRLSEAERELRRHLQVILPEGAAAEDYVEKIRAWPSVEDAWVGPQVSLPARD